MTRNNLLDDLMRALSHLHPLASESESPTENQSAASEPAETVIVNVAFPVSHALVEQPHFGIRLDNAPTGGWLKISYSSNGVGFLLYPGNWFRIPRGCTIGHYIVDAGAAGDYELTYFRDRWFEPSPAACCDPEPDASVLATEDGFALSTEDGRALLVT